MVKMTHKIYTGLLMVVLIIGCKKSGLDEESFLSPRKQYDMAVEGGFNTLTVNQYIRLTKPSMHPDSVPAPIRNASVVVNDGRENLVYLESEKPGVYVASYLGDPNYNKAYKLTIKYAGETYTAVDTLRQVVNIVDDFLPLSTRLNADQKVEGTIPKHTFGYLNPNKWYICYDKIPFWHPGEFGQARYYSYTHFLGSPNSLYLLDNLKSTFSLGQEEYIYIYKISLSGNYAKYLYSVFMETDWIGLFSGVPASVKGNFSGNVQGFFSVVDIDLRRYKAKEL